MKKYLTHGSLELNHQLNQNSKRITRQEDQTAISKNQLIYLEKCLTHGRLESNHQLNQKATRITKEYQKKLLVLAKNDGKQRLRNYNMKVNDLSQKLRSILSDAHFETIERMTNKS